MTVSGILSWLLAVGCTGKASFGLAAGCTGPACFGLTLGCTGKTSLVAISCRLHRAIWLGLGL